MGYRQRLDAASYVLSRESSPQEPANEGVGGLVLAQYYNADTHSQRLAMVSDIDRPSTIFFGSGLTRTGPSPSRKNHLPLAPAM